MRTDTQAPRISFGMIVLNGEPFIRYNLRALYPFAHEIIVVEGASPNAAADATADGHSIDGTLETLRRFEEEEDPHDKLRIVTRDGFWREKDEQSHAYAERVTGDYLWQVDVDEFYRPEDMRAIIELLRTDPSITGMAFQARFFWGGFDYCVESGRMQYPHHNECRRVFKFGPGYRYASHRPPTVREPSGVDVMKINALDKRETAARGLFFHHYYAVFPNQVKHKARYYTQIGWAHTSRMETWARDTWLRLKRPLHAFHAYDNYSWLKRFTGQHPPVIRALQEDLRKGVVHVEQRPVDDIERLLKSPWYRLARAYAQTVEHMKLRWSRASSGDASRPRTSQTLGQVLGDGYQGGRLIARALVAKLRDDWLAQYVPVKPTVIQFPVNDVCNGRCVMCNIWQRKRDTEITPEELRRILTDPLFGNVRYVGINGGEPTLRADLADIGRALIESLPKLRGLNVITNAVQTQKVVERVLALAEVAQAGNVAFETDVSLDGIGEDHDRNRGVTGSFASAVEVIKRLRRAGVPVSVGCTLTPVNCHAADDVLLWCEENGIGKWKFRLGVPIKRTYNDGYAERHPFTPEQRFHLIMFFDKLAHQRHMNPAHRRFYSSLVGQLAFGKPRQAGCDWRSRGVTLDARGSLSYCSVQSPILGSALTDSARGTLKKGLPERRRILRDHCDRCRHDLLGPVPASVLAREGIKVIAKPWRRPELNGLGNGRAGSFRAPRTIRSADRPCPRDWRHVLITGWYGTETAGDKPILGELVHFIKANAPDCDITLTTLDRKVSQQTNRELKELEHVTLVDTDRGYDPALIESVDAVIMGGGPLQQIAQTEYVWRMFAEANRQAKARVIFGCGVGPLYSERLRTMVGAVLQMATAGFLRDDQSRDLALRLGGDPSLGCACDPALAYLQRWVADAPVPSSNDGAIRIAGLVRANTNEYIRDISYYELKNVNLQTASRIARILESVCTSRRAVATLLPMHALWVGGDDRMFNRQIAACFDAKTAVRVERVYLPLDALLAALRSARAAVAMRYHGHLFCMALGIPFLSIDYTGKPGKVHSLVARTGYEQWSEQWRNIDVDRAASRLERLIAEHDHWAAYLRQKTDDLVRQLRKTYTQVFDVDQSLSAVI